MPTDDERREVARRLRETGEKLGSAALLWHHIVKALGVRTATDGKTACDMLADLIDPTCEVHRDTLFYPATGLTEEREKAVFRCGKCEEIVSFDADYDPGTDLPAYCELCGSRITGIGEPWDE